MLTCRPLSLDLLFCGEGVGGCQVEKLENLHILNRLLNVNSTLTSCLAVVFGGGFGSEPRSGPFGPRSVLAMFAIVRLSWLLVISLSSTLASLGFSFSTLLSLASGLRFDAGCVVAFSCSSFTAERRGGSVPLGEVCVIAIGWVTKSSS